MMRDRNTGDTAGLPVTKNPPVVDLAFYDDLPEPVRRAIREASNHLSCQPLAEMLQNGESVAAVVRHVVQGDAFISRITRRRHYGIT